MRKIIILLIALQIVTATAQDFEPSSATFNFNSSSSTYTNTAISSELPYFQQNNFILGFQWGAQSKRFTKAMNSTERHAGPSEKAINIVDNCDLIILSPGNTHCDKGDTLNARGIQYEPTLLIDNPGEFKTREGDNTNPVFGFKNINGYISDNQQDPNYGRLAVGTVGSNLYTGVILENPWPDNELI
jgi:hypothetical protein